MAVTLESDTRRSSQHLSDFNTSGSVNLDTSSNASSGGTMTTLSSIPSASIKERNYLVGNVTKPLSLSGVDEFNRCFPDGHLRLFVGTWNMQKCKLPENVDNFLLPDEEDYLQDMYVIGVQEATPDQRNWEVKLQETLGMSHVLVHSLSHGVLHLAVFVKRDLIWYCSCFEDGKVTTRMISLLKTKGAIAISFRCFGTSFLFITAHFQSGETNTRERIEDYQRICEKLQLPFVSPQNIYQERSKDVTERFDCVFWFGDLNFRISQPQQLMKMEVEDPSTYSIHEAMKCDQLKGSIKRGKVFKGFVEPPINFLPTYKFNPDSDEYDTSQKLRVPSYTDRILHKAKVDGAVTCTKYDSIPSLKQSDHRPVYALYEVDLRPGKKRFSLSSGQFNREVYMEAARRRAHCMKNQRSYVCTLL